MGSTRNANGTKANSDRTAKRGSTKPKATAKRGSTKPKATAKRTTAKRTTITPSQRRTENGGYIRFTCTAPFHAKVTASASKAGVSIVAHCLDITSKGIKSNALAKLPSKLQEAPKNAKPYPCYVNVEMSATLRERVKKLGAKLSAPAHVIVRELVHNATKSAKPSSSTAKRTTKPKATAKRGSKRTTAKRTTAKRTAKK